VWKAEICSRDNCGKAVCSSFLIESGIVRL
jgi:hypothetical protein